MTHQERYKKAEVLPMQEMVANVRRVIGETANGESPTPDQIEETVDSLYPKLLTSERSKIAAALIRSEEEAAAEADRLADAE